MTAQTAFLLVLAVAVAALVVIVVALGRMRGMGATNDRIETNQRQALDLQRRQTEALERIAAVLERQPPRA